MLTLCMLDEANTGSEEAGLAIMARIQAEIDSLSHEHRGNLYRTVMRDDIPAYLQQLANGGLSEAELDHYKCILAWIEQSYIVYLNNGMGHRFDEFIIEELEYNRAHGLENTWQYLIRSKHNPKKLNPKKPGIKAWIIPTLGLGIVIAVVLALVS